MSRRARLFSALCRKASRSARKADARGIGMTLQWMGVAGDIMDVLTFATVRRFRRER